MTASASGGTRSSLPDVPRLTQLSELIVYPKYGRKRNLRPDGLYNTVFKHVQYAWRDSVQLIPDVSFAENGSPFIAVAVPFYSHIVVAGQRYGASTAPRGIKYRYAYIDGRQAVDIIHLLRVEHTTNDGLALTADLAIVRPFLASPDAAMMPWEGR